MKYIGRGEWRYASFVGMLRVGVACPHDLRPYNSLYLI